MIINTLNETQTISFDLTENWAVRAGRQYKVRDMWLHKDVGIAIRNWTVTLEAHDVAALLLSDAGPEPKGGSPPCAEPFLVHQCTAPKGSYIDGGALLEWGF
jgi:alpha-galactosidase